MQSESIESQLAEEKCLMEQKYASMLQQVLAEKQLVRFSVHNIIVTTHAQLGSFKLRTICTLYTHIKPIIFFP